LVVVTPPASKKLDREISGKGRPSPLLGKPARPSSFNHTIASEIPCSQVQKSLLIAVKFPAPSRREFCRKPLISLQMDDEFVVDSPPDVEIPCKPWQLDPNLF
jgi:hypothetical protein